ncbi:hypothetical protein LSH36_703g00002 [Paralvinella palmiformis]|uniref:Uncharacterized protein n=1 Tax=Paralvinella palmiformis TaxID=53620 RepID=A0AAD9MW12_9ANNE|nr:hypothetical protein LSH36_703g00002 [Paralvinella palmiformis]
MYISQDCSPSLWHMDIQLTRSGRREVWCQQISKHLIKQTT